MNSHIPNLHNALNTESPFSLLFASLVLIALAAVAGCDDAVPTRPPVHPVSGRVVLNGNPLPHAYVVLHPKTGAQDEAMPARGLTDSQGRFQLTSYEENDGAAAGEYVVTVEHFPLLNSGEGYVPGPNQLSSKLANPATTDITVRVAEGHNELPAIQVRR